MLSDKPTFGPGGNGDWFYRDGGKSTVQAPAWLEKIGLDAYEYEAGRGVVAGEESLRAVGEAAAAHGIRMSLHAPYFISLSGAVEEKRLLQFELPVESRRHLYLAYRRDYILQPHIKAFCRFVETSSQ